MCCNLVSEGNTIVVGKGISENLKKTFKANGFEIIETLMKEFLKGET